MKNTIATSLLALGLMFSGAALADGAKPAKLTKVDTMTTQSIEPAGDTMRCSGALPSFKMMKICGDANKYPVNALGGMNLN